jgi:hypothetical protein
MSIKKCNLLYFSKLLFFLALTNISANDDDLLFPYNTTTKTETSPSSSLMEQTVLPSRQVILDREKAVIHDLSTWRTKPNITTNNNKHSFLHRFNPVKKAAAAIKSFSPWPAVTEPEDFPNGFVHYFPNPKEVRMWKEIEATIPEINKHTGINRGNLFYDQMNKKNEQLRDHMFGNSVQTHYERLTKTQFLPTTHIARREIFTRAFFIMFTLRWWMVKWYTYMYSLLDMVANPGRNVGSRIEWLEIMMEFFMDFVGSKNICY